MASTLILEAPEGRPNVPLLPADSEPAEESRDSGLRVLSVAAIACEWVASDYPASGLLGRSD
eukprot:14258953-Alexandrium_andersonii.AAC.1